MKQLKVSSEYCAKVGKAINKTAEEVKNLIEKLWNSGLSIDEIKSRLINMAKGNGKNLIFTSKKNTN